MSGVIQGIARNKSIISLNLSRNMTNVKSKHFPTITEAIVQLLQDEETAVQKLNLCDCKLKAELGNVINALGSNQFCLRCRLHSTNFVISFSSGHRNFVMYKMHNFVINLHRNFKDVIGNHIRATENYTP